MSLRIHPIPAAARLLAPALAGAALASFALAQATLFPVEHSYSAIFGPYGCAAADLDGDGNLDVVLANSGAMRLTVFRGVGDGTLQFQSPFPIGGSPQSVVAGDFNGDGIPDLAATCGGLDSVVVLLGQGAFAFGPPTAHAVDDFPAWVQAGDVDGDADLDLVCASQGGEQLSVLRGDGQGGFAPAVFHPLGVTAEQLALGDLDGDGDLDAVVSSWFDDRLVAMRNDGSGAYTLTVAVVADDPRGIALHDVDGDGKLDAIATSTSTDSVVVQRGNGLGGFTAPPKQFAVGDYPVAVQVADLTSDGRPDLVVACSSPGTIEVLVNVGGGLFQRATSSPVTPFPTYLVIGDLNQDGRTDVVLTNFGQKVVSTHLGTAFGGWDRYCTGKLNSQGCRPSISATGAPSASHRYPFAVRTDLLVDHSSGIYLYALNAAKAAIPFQGGTLCMGGGGIKRTPGFVAGGTGACTGSFGLDFNAFAAGLAGGNPDAGLKVPGASYLVQAWARDPFSGQFPTSLSDALDVVIGP